jgi:hypothetical protein
MYAHARTHVLTIPRTHSGAVEFALGLSSKASALRRVPGVKRGGVTADEATHAREVLKLSESVMAERQRATRDANTSSGCVDDQEKEHEQSWSQRTIDELRSALAALEKLTKEKAAGCFEWSDGILVKALRAGEWVLLESVNLCNPTVLDRLNPLLEPGGELMLNERGLVDGQVSACLFLLKLGFFVA